MAGWFEISRSSDGQFRFALKAGNAETILTSELYKSRDAAENGIESVRKNAGPEARYEKKTPSDGRLFFNLEAGNHQTIGSSQMYTTEKARDAGIESVMANGSAEEVKDKT